MHYGRTILEAIVVQALLLTAIMVVPFGVVASLSPEVSALFATGVAGGLSLVLYMRHTSRLQRGAGRDFNAQTQSNPA